MVRTGRAFLGGASSALSRFPGSRINAKAAPSHAVRHNGFLPFRSPLTVTGSLRILT